ncbi:MAG: hypothetical protein Q9219_002708 [cf. Caloplaca sp. 3 TL-2023]
MALAYPEGECFFARSALCSSAYNANDPKDFFSHMMVEYVWNAEAHHGWSNSQGHRHPRSAYRIVRGSNWETNYGNWTHLPFSYGTHPTKITRRVQHELCTSGNFFKARENGESYQPYFMTMPMPTTEERCVWIDCLAYIRAIYLPVAFSVSEDHQDLCSFVQTNFALSRTVKFYSDDGQIHQVETHAALGISPNVQKTIGIDVSGLISLLALPRPLRRDNCYNLKLLKLEQTTLPESDPGLEKTFSCSPDVSWLTVAKGNFGLDLTWKPPQKTTWEENFIKNCINFGLGWVPFAGPVLQIMFSVGWTFISTEDPEAAFSVLKDLSPGLDLQEKIVKEIIKSANETKLFLPDGWQQLGLKTSRMVSPIKSSFKPIEDMDAMLPMLLQKEVLMATGKDPEKGTSAEDEGEGETVLDQAAGGLMDAGESVTGVVGL